jgi:hypothetical protein
VEVGGNEKEVVGGKEKEVMVGEEVDEKCFRDSKINDTSCFSLDGNKE